MKKLFCIPYAGGASTVFNGLKDAIDTCKIEIIPLELKGRGTRSKEKFYSSFNEAVQDLVILIENKIDKNEEISLLGYSLGSLIAYEVVKRLEEKGYICKNLIIMANNAPNISVKELLDENDDGELMRFVKNLGMFNEKKFYDARFLNIYIKIIREDFKILKDYRKSTHNKKVYANLTVMYGNEDYLHQNAESWRGYTRNKFQIYSLSHAASY